MNENISYYEELNKARYYTAKAECVFLNNESKKLESELKRLGREEQAELKRLKREARKLAVLLKRAERDMLTLEDMIYLDLVAIKNQKNIENIKNKLIPKKEKHSGINFDRSELLTKTTNVKKDRKIKKDKFISFEVITSKWHRYQTIEALEYLKKTGKITINLNAIDVI